MEETKTKGTRGGARPGAGRKPINGDIPTKRVMFRLTAEQEELVREFLRQNVFLLSFYKSCLLSYL